MSFEIEWKLLDTKYNILVFEVNWLYNKLQDSFDERMCRTLQSDSMWIKLWCLIGFLQKLFPTQSRVDEPDYIIYLSN